MVKYCWEQKTDADDPTILSNSHRLASVPLLLSSRDCLCVRFIIEDIFCFWGKYYCYTLDSTYIMKRSLCNKSCKFCNWNLQIECASNYTSIVRYFIHNNYKTNSYYCKQYFYLHTNYYPEKIIKYHRLGKNLQKSITIVSVLLFSFRNLMA